jgi:hypothetical protein
MNEGMRRLAVTIATIGLMTMSGAALAEKAAGDGTITGFVFNCDQNTKAVAVAADETRYETKVRRNCHYRITNLPSGTYEIEFTQGKTTWIAEDDAVVEGAKEAVINTANPAAR